MVNRSPHPVLIVGAGGLAREMAALLMAIDPQQRVWRLLGFVDRQPADAATPSDLPILCDDESLLRDRSVKTLVLGVGDPSLRLRLARAYAALPDFAFPTLIHPSSDVRGPRVVLGAGNVFTANVVLTCDIGIGDWNLFNLNVTVGHDVRIGSGCVINPGANISGGAVLGDGVLVGTGVQILEGVVIGDYARVGAGAVVTRPVAPGSTVVGIPAKPLGEH